MLRQLAILTTMWPLTLAWNKMCHSFLWNLLWLKNLNKTRLSNTLTKAHVIIALLFLFFLFFLLLLLFGLLSTATSTTSSRCSNSSRSSWSNVADQSTKILTWKGVVITSSPSQHTQRETLSPCGSSKYKQTLQGEGGTTNSVTLERWAVHRGWIAVYKYTGYHVWQSKNSVKMFFSGAFHMLYRPWCKTWLLVLRHVHSFNSSIWWIFTSNIWQMNDCYCEHWTT